MAKIHATLTPLDIFDTKKEILVLKFDAPLTARNVKVQLLETDANEGGKDDLIAIFQGKIVKPRKFQGRLIRKGESSANAPSFKFQFEHDATVYELKIPSGRGEHEHEDYEIVLKVDGTVAGNIRNFVSKAPVFIRGLPQASQVAQHRPVVTFIARKSKKKFYGAARLFWDPVSDGISYNVSLEKIIDFLNHNSNQKTKDGLEYGKWGDINIVSHANEEGRTSLLLFTPPKGKKKGKLVTVKSLKDFKNDARLALTTKNIDDQTRIIWRGCKVGGTQELLIEVRKLFGGKCHVYGPKYIQWYETTFTVTRQPKKKPVKVSHTWEYFLENFYFDIPWPYPKKAKLPKPGKCAERLMREYPTIKYNHGAKKGQTLDKAGWLALIKDKKSRYDTKKKPIFYPYLLLLEEKPKYYKKVVRNQLKAYRAPFFKYEDYYWKIRKPRRLKKDEEDYKEGYRWKVPSRGAKYRLEVRRPLRDDNGNIDVPTLTKTKHYGHSSP